MVSEEQELQRAVEHAEAQAAALEGQLAEVQASRARLTAEALAEAQARHAQLAAELEATAAEQSALARECDALLRQAAQPSGWLPESMAGGVGWYLRATALGLWVSALVAGYRHYHSAGLLLGLVLALPLAVLVVMVTSSLRESGAPDTAGDGAGEAEGAPLGAELGSPVDPLAGGGGEAGDDPPGDERARAPADGGPGPA